MYLKSEHIVLWGSKLCMLSANGARFPSLLCLLCLSLDLLLLIRHSLKEFWYSGVFLVYKFFKSLCSMHAWKYSILQKDGHQKFTTEMVIISKLILTYLNYFFFNLPSRKLWIPLQLNLKYYCVAMQWQSFEKQYRYSTLAIFFHQKVANS